jgi:beta-glucosidase
MPWADDVAAVLVDLVPGRGGRRALADVLAGDAEPAGRLPFVIPAEPAHLPHFDRDATEITYDLFHGQWKLDRDGHVAQFPFGAGDSGGGRSTSSRASRSTTQRW